MRIIILALFICSCQAVWANCPRLPLENGFFVPHLEIYEHKVNISYGCDTGWKPALKKWWGEITCTDGTWSHTPQCIDKTLCITPHVPHAESVSELESFYPSGKVVSFRCNSGYEADGGKSEAQCADGKWSVPKCKMKRSSCAPPPRVENGMIEQAYKDVFAHGARLQYICAKGYKLKRYDNNICQNGQWKNHIQCEKARCYNPRVQNGNPVETLKNSYNIGDHVEFKCRSSYEFEDTKFAECVDGSWKLPICKPRLETSCDAPRVANAVLVGSLVLPFPSGNSVQFKCNNGYDFEETHFAVCENGHWKLPVCKRAGGPGGPGGPETSRVISPVHDCGEQPLIENGDVIEIQGGMQLKVLCKTLYKLQGTENVGCVAGQWTELPVCKPPCKLDRTRFLSSDHPDEYLPDGENKRFYCSAYTYYTITISCRDGRLRYGPCE